MTLFEFCLFVAAGAALCGIFFFGACFVAFVIVSRLDRERSEKWTAGSSGKGGRK